MEGPILKPGIYRHYKGKEYEGIGIATHSETSGDTVEYRARHEPHKLDNDHICIRP